MSLLRYLEAKLPPFDKMDIDKQLPAIKGKVWFIAKLIDDVTLLFEGKQTFPEKFSDVDSFSNSLKAHDEIQDELRKLIVGLFKPTFPQGITYFDTHINNLKTRQLLVCEVFKVIHEESPECYKRIIKKIEAQSHKGKAHNYLFYIEHIKLMGNPEYEPDIEIDDLVIMLQELFYYWLTWPSSRLEIAVESNPPEVIDAELVGLLVSTSDIEAGLDLSLAKIASQVGKRTALIRQWGRREGNRMEAANQQKKANKEEVALLVRKTFNSLIFPKEIFPVGASFHKVAGMIENILKDKIKDPPSIPTIKRALKNDEQIWKQFELKGRNYLIKQM